MRRMTTALTTPSAIKVRSGSHCRRSRRTLPTPNRRARTQAGSCWRLKARQAQRVRPDCRVQRAIQAPWACPGCKDPKGRQAPQVRAVRGLVASMASNSSRSRVRSPFQRASHISWLRFGEEAVGREAVVLALTIPIRVPAISQAAAAAELAASGALGEEAVLEATRAL